MAKWLKTTESCSFDVKERVARITLNRPEKRNALSHPLLRELHEALLEADDRTDVNVIVLQGAGKDFCAGYDLVSTYSDRKADEAGGAHARRSATEVSRHDRRRLLAARIHATPDAGDVRRA